MQAALRDYPQPPARSNHSRLHGPLPGLWEAAQQGLRLQQSSGTCCACSRMKAASEGQGMQPDVAAADGRHRSGSKCCACTSSGSESIWTAGGSGPPAQQLLQKLRWVTLGPQFDWTMRAYSGVDSPHTPLPTELREAAQRIASACAEVAPAGVSSDRSACAHDASCSAEDGGGACECAADDCHQRAAEQAVEQHWPRDERGHYRSCACRAGAGKGQQSCAWEPDVALVNYYREGETLGGHVDDVERDQDAPIVALSLGSSAVFLLGGAYRSFSCPERAVVAVKCITLQCRGRRWSIHACMPRHAKERRAEQRL